MVLHSAKLTVHRYHKFEYSCHVFRHEGQKPEKPGSKATSKKSGKAEKVGKGKEKSKKGGKNAKQSER